MRKRDLLNTEYNKLTTQQTGTSICHASPYDQCGTVHAFIVPDGSFGLFSVHACPAVGQTASLAGSILNPESVRVLPARHQ